MQVKLSRDCRGPHPEYDWSRSAAEQSVPHQRTLEAGTLIDGPDAVYLMRAGLAEPHDDEARESLAAHTARRQRIVQQRIERIAARRRGAKKIAS